MGSYDGSQEGTVLSRAKLMAFEGKEVMQYLTFSEGVAAENPG